MFVVRQRPLAPVVNITAAKEDVRRSQSARLQFRTQLLVKTRGQLWDSLTY